eukprot:gene18744-20633_t
MGESSCSNQGNQPDRIASLYPNLNEAETPLPRFWSPKDKFSLIGLSQNNLRVHYKGIGKNPKDAASVRTTYPIPAACGLYYFEIKVISKGRDGYIGVGLSSQGVNMNRLPGWEKNSYGYHGDDGHSFCSSGTGQSYGPTFTTGDVIGCGLNLINRTCFYTKNGINLGVAFADLPRNLYPTVGLQTPGEVIDANFGQQPFTYDIEEMRKELRARAIDCIDHFPVSVDGGNWQETLQRIVSAYLVHHGYCQTAEVFSKSAGQSFSEEIASIKNRQRIQKLILAGRISEGIEATQSLYPGLLDRNLGLMFKLKCRQFIEMVSGCDSEVKPSAHSPTRSSSKPSPSASPARVIAHPGLSTQSSNSTTNGYDVGESGISRNMDIPEDGVSNGVIMDEDMEVEDEVLNSNAAPITATAAIPTASNQLTSQNLSSQSRVTVHIDAHPSVRQLCGGNILAIEKLLAFGKELQIMYKELAKECGCNEGYDKLMRDAFSLLAYNDPWNSPVGFQLHPVQREPVCAALNSAILESYNLPAKPSLELAVGQIKSCLKQMAKSGLGACAFADVDDFLCR